MKKITLTLVCTLALMNPFFGQGNFLVEAPLNNGSTTQVRAPNGLSTSGTMRACALVLASELTNIPNGSAISSFGFTLATSTVVTVPVTGNFTVYLENTSDLTYQKGTNFTTAIATMSTCYTSTMTIPIATTTSSVTVTLSTPFVYTGGGLYVAYDWYSNGPYSAATNPATYWAEQATLNPGCATAAGATTAAAPNVLTNTAFRPAFLFGGVNSFTNDVQYIGMEAALGHVPAMLGTAQNVKAIIKNASNVANTNIPVSMNVTGANTFVDTQTISTLAAGATTTVTFNAFNPIIPGNNTITVSVPSDQNNINNSGTFLQTVNCNEWGVNPSPGNYTTQAVGFGTGSGILACQFSNAATTTLTGLRSAVSNNAPSVGNSVWGVLLNSAGAIVATTNTVVLTAAMLNTFQTFTFATPQVLTGASAYYLGFAQPANATAWYPAGAMTTHYLASSIYYNMPLAGGTPAPLGVNLGYFGIEAIFSPTVNISLPQQTINCGSSATLSASGANTYTWNTSANTSTLAVNPLVTTLYTVSGTDGIGCTASKTTTLTVTPLAISVAASGNTIMCEGEVITFTASGAQSFGWTVGTSTVGTGSVFTATPQTATNFQVVGTDPSGCFGTASAFVLVIASPTVAINSSTNTVCLGGNLTLNASGASNYTWTNTGATLASIVETPSLTTTYSVIGTNTFGCSDTETITVTVNSFTPGITSSTAICNGEQLNLNATGGAGGSYLWSNGTTVFPQITVSPTTTTVYSVSATGATNNCAGVASTTITVNPIPTLTATANRTVMCRNESNTVSVSGASSYSWSSGQTSQSFVITPTVASVLSYSISGIDSHNCTGSTALVLKVDACTGIGESTGSSSAISIFPNPGNGKLTIETSANTRALISVFNALGKLVKVQEMSGERATLDISSEASGVYFVNIRFQDKTTFTSKVIKE